MNLKADPWEDLETLCQTHQKRERDTGPNK